MIEQGLLFSEQPLLRMPKFPGSESDCPARKFMYGSPEYCWEHKEVGESDWRVISGQMGVSFQWQDSFGDRWRNDIAGASNVTISSPTTYAACRLVVTAYGKNYYSYVLSFGPKGANNSEQRKAPIWYEWSEGIIWLQNNSLRVFPRTTLSPEVSEGVPMSRR